MQGRVEGFPAGFIWGCSNASYQSEGSLHELGRGESIWDVFCRLGGKVAGGGSGEGACDSWRRMEEDVALLRGLGVGAYRFSLSWPRIQPSGKGRPVQGAIDHYLRFCDLLAEAGIEPIVTLYHWDLPQALEDEGGWPMRETAFRFADYAALAFDALGGRVRRWVTLNEPWCSAFLGYGSGEHAPGRKDIGSAYRAAHHLLLGHGLAVGSYRETGLPGEIGITLNPATPRPATRREQDILAAQRFSVERTALWLDPLYGRGYPEAHLAARGIAMPIEAGDLGRIAAELDFLGVNYYNEDAIEAAPAGAGNPDGVAYAGDWHGRTAMGWSIVPDGLARMLARIHGQWRPKALWVTENGAAFADEDMEAGRVHDRDRIEYLRSHIASCRDAIAAGLPLRGYLAWTLMDNFEWSFGYTRKFGLVRVDSATGERHPKDSYHWYRDLLAGFVAP